MTWIDAGKCVTEGVGLLGCVLGVRRFKIIDINRVSGLLIDDMKSSSAFVL